jgi:hypothetical protein
MFVAQPNMAKANCDMLRSEKICHNPIATFWLTEESVCLLLNLWLSLEASLH